MKITLLLLSIFFLKAFPNQDHALVYFKDKVKVSASISNPSSILSKRAVDRKKKYKIAIDERDVPVNEAYISALKAQPGITVKAKSKWFNCAHVIGQVADISNLESLSYVEKVVFSRHKLNRDQGIIYSKPKDKLKSATEFNYGSAMNQVRQLNVDKLHEYGYTGEGILVALMDAGFPKVNTMKVFQKLRDEGDLLGGYDFVNRTRDVFAYTSSDHGTLVLSTMAANVEGKYVGTAPDASYYLFRTEESARETPVEESYWVEAAERADSLGVDVINTSLGYNVFDDKGYDYSISDMDGKTAFISRAANIATEKGMLLVNSAGNEGDTGWQTITAPADANVLTVGAVNSNGDYAYFSSTGPSADGRIKPDVVAQGRGVVVVDRNDYVAISNGTSFSSPIIAGAVASLWQALPEKNNLELMSLIRESASDYYDPTDKKGYGIPDFFSILGSNVALPQQNNSFKIFPNPTSAKFMILMPAGTVTCKLELYDVLGKKIMERTVSQKNNQVDISSLNKGVYIAQLSSSQTKKTLKIVKQ